MRVMNNWQYLSADAVCDLIKVVLYDLKIIMHFECRTGNSSGNQIEQPCN